jgi:hypothetical protein
MNVVISSLFRTLYFPHDGKIMMVDQLSFTYAIPNAFFGPSIHVVKNYQPTIENIGVKMYSSLMGTFEFMAPIHHVYSMSSRLILLERSIPFLTSYFNDPWTLPSLIDSCKGQLHAIMDLPLLAIDIAYQVVLDSSIDPNPITSQMDGEDLICKPMWATLSSCSHHYLDETFPLDEAIIESMNGSEKPWDDMHHCTCFLPEISRIEQDEFRSTLSKIVCHAIIRLDTHGIYAKGNMVRISPTFMIDISHTHGKIENVHIGADCS